MTDLDAIEHRLSITRPIPPDEKVRCAVRDPWAAARAIEAILDQDVPALIAEVRRLRATIAGVETLHTRTTWRQYATEDCWIGDCDGPDRDHDECVEGEWEVCESCVEIWHAIAMEGWDDNPSPSESTLWPCPTHAALHPQETS